MPKSPEVDSRLLRAHPFLGGSVGSRPNLGTDFVVEPAPHSVETGQRRPRVKSALDVAQWHRGIDADLELTGAGNLELGQGSPILCSCF